jgi:hypothetical protein
LSSCRMAHDAAFGLAAGLAAGENQEAEGEYS